MKRIPKAVYQTAAEIEARIRSREIVAASSTSGDERQNILKEIAQLRVYAEAKRWMDSPSLQQPRPQRP